MLLFVVYDCCRLIVLDVCLDVFVIRVLLFCVLAFWFGVSLA